jgi:hypothetical protein
MVRRKKTKSQILRPPPLQSRNTVNTLQFCFQLDTSPLLYAYVDSLHDFLTEKDRGETEKFRVLLKDTVNTLTRGSNTYKLTDPGLWKELFSSLYLDDLSNSDDLSKSKSNLEREIEQRKREEKRVLLQRERELFSEYIEWSTSPQFNGLIQKIKISLSESAINRSVCIPPSNVMLNAHTKNKPINTDAFDHLIVGKWVVVNHNEQFIYVNVENTLEILQNIFLDYKFTSNPQDL